MATSPQKSLSSGQRIAAVIGAILVVALLAAWIIWRIVYNATTYKAVFLTNGQVYFGKLYNGMANPLTLHDIYYLQQQNSQPQDGQQTDTSNGSIQLIKLGNEIHGPKDFMRINADQVLFIEDLKDSGQVVKLIEQFKKNGNAPTSTPSQSSTPSPTKS